MSTAAPIASQGRCRYYEADAARVRAERQRPGWFSLLIISRGGGTAVAVIVDDAGFTKAPLTNASLPDAPLTNATPDTR